MNRLIVMSALLSVATLTACAGDRVVTHSGGISRGSQTNTGPTINDGSGKPSNATNYTCASSDGCAYWYCQCADGFIVNSANCYNGYCLDAAGSCPNACDTFHHGAWTGVAGGGPGGSSGTDPIDDGSSSNPGPTGSSCSECVDDYCSYELSACTNNPDCVSYSDCVQGCYGDYDCVSTCDEYYQYGIDDFYAFLDCGQSWCSDECE